MIEIKEITGKDLKRISGGANNSELLKAYNKIASGIDTFASKNSDKSSNPLERKARLNFLKDQVWYGLQQSNDEGKLDDDLEHLLKAEGLPALGAAVGLSMSAEDTFNINPDTKWLIDNYADWKGPTID